MIDYWRRRRLTTTTVISFVNSGYVASEQTTKKTPSPTIRLLLCTHLLPCNVFTEPLVSNFEATTYIPNFNILTLPASQHVWLPSAYMTHPTHFNPKMEAAHSSITSVSTNKIILYL
jgi:hypothetical protein